MDDSPENTACKPLDTGCAAPHLRGVVAVTGAASRAGKTMAMEAIIPILKRRGHAVTALKVTRTDKGECPRLHPTCTTCNDLSEPFQLITDSRRINVAGKDTGRYCAAGADQVLWLQAEPDSLAEGVAHALGHVPDGHVLMGEGNAFREHFQADVTIMALGRNLHLKASALAIIAFTDAWACHPIGLNSAKTWIKEAKLNENAAFSTENWDWLTELLAAQDL